MLILPIQELVIHIIIKDGTLKTYKYYRCIKTPNSYTNSIISFGKSIEIYSQRNPAIVFLFKKEFNK